MHSLDWLVYRDQYNDFSLKLVMMVLNAILIMLAVFGVRVLNASREPHKV